MLHAKKNSWMAVNFSSLRLGSPFRLLHWRSQLWSMARLSWQCRKQPPILEADIPCMRLLLAKLFPASEEIILMQTSMISKNWGHLKIHPTTNNQRSPLQLEIVIIIKRPKEQLQRSGILMSLSNARLYYSIVKNHHNRWQSLPVFHFFIDWVTKKDLSKAFHLPRWYQQPCQQWLPHKGYPKGCHVALRSKIAAWVTSPKVQLCGTWATASGLAKAADQFFAIFRITLSVDVFLFFKL